MNKTSNEYALMQAKLQSFIVDVILDNSILRPTSVSIDDNALHTAIGYPDDMSEAYNLLSSLLLDLSARTFLPHIVVDQEDTYWEDFPPLIDSFEMNKTDTAFEVLVFPNYDNLFSIAFLGNGIIPSHFINNIQSFSAFCLLNLLDHRKVCSDPLAFSLAELSRRISLPVLFENADIEILPDRSFRENLLVQYVQSHINPLLLDINANNPDVFVSLRKLYFDKHGKASISFDIEYASSASQVSSVVARDPVSEASKPSLTNPIVSAIDALNNQPRQKVKVRAKRSVVNYPSLIPHQYRECKIDKRDVAQLFQHENFDLALLISRIKSHPHFVECMEELESMGEDEETIRFLNNLIDFIAPIVIDLGYSCG